MNKIKVGIDLVKDDRFKEKINKSFIEKIYQPSEMKNERRMASIFSLKEAVFKALEISSNNWLEIEINYNKKGKPNIILSDIIKPNNLVSIDCSVTHENGLTQTIVVMLLNEKE